MYKMLVAAASWGSCAASGEGSDLWQERESRTHTGTTNQGHGVESWEPTETMGGYGLSLCNLVVSASLPSSPEARQPSSGIYLQRLGEVFYVSYMAVKMSGFCIEFCALYFEVLPRAIMKFLWGMWNSNVHFPILTASCVDPVGWTISIIWPTISLFTYKLSRHTEPFLCFWGGFFWLYSAACEILVLWPGIESWPQQWKCQVLTTGLPGNFWAFSVFKALY